MIDEEGRRDCRRRRCRYGCAGWRERWRRWPGEESWLLDELPDLRDTPDTRTRHSLTTTREPQRKPTPRELRRSPRRHRRTRRRLQRSSRRQLIHPPARLLSRRPRRRLTHRPTPLLSRRPYTSLTSTATTLVESLWVSHLRKTGKSVPFVTRLSQKRSLEEHPHQRPQPRHGSSDGRDYEDGGGQI